MFLMATSAIGPGFITQTTAFTDQLGGRLRLRDRGVDPVRHRDPAERLAGHRRLRPPRPGPGNGVLPGAGYVLAGLDAARRAGLQHRQHRGLLARASTPSSASTPRVGGGHLGRWSRSGSSWSAGPASPWTASWSLLGVVMIVLTTFVAIKTPARRSATRCADASLPETASFLVITTLIGGTVGGYIVYAGAHRLRRQRHQGRRVRPRDHPQLDHRHRDHRRDAGAAVPRRPRRGRPAAPSSTRSNPAADAFDHALGEAGKIVFGVDHVVRRDHLGDRRVVHLHLVPQGARHRG